MAKQGTDVARNVVSITNAHLVAIRVVYGTSSPPSVDTSPTRS